MAAESAIDVSVQANGSAKRLPIPIAVLVWAASAVCIGFTMCYAYHIGL